MNAEMIKKFDENTYLEMQADVEHEFLMTTKQVAKGYGCSESVLRSHKRKRSDGEYPELIEGKHFVSSVQKMDARRNLEKTVVYWTKRGVIRLGFWIETERAKIFRDWAEELILGAVEDSEFALAQDGSEAVLTTNQVVDLFFGLVTNAENVYKPKRRRARKDH